jgi:hypothetical protein
MDGKSSGASVTSRRRVVLWAMAMAAGGLVLAACSSGPSAAPKTNGPRPLISQAKADNDYTKASTPAVATLGTLSNAARTWNAATTPTEAAAQARPTIVSMISLEPKLSTLAFDYPAAASDLKAEIDAAGAIQDDIADLGDVNFADSTAWTQKYESDVAKLNAAAKRVRADLGLHPSS